MKNYFRGWYDENSGKASTAEMFLFYVSLLVIFFFIISVLFDGTFCGKHLVLFTPTLIWIFLRSSRKDMKATAHWVAGLLGAIGGAASVLLLRIFLK